MPGKPNKHPGGRAGAYSTALADAVYLASEEIMQSQAGRKALIILGDGDHIGDREAMAIKAAQQADTIIYTVRIYDKSFGSDRGGWTNIIRVPTMGGPGGREPRAGPGGGGPRGPGGPDNRADGKKNLKSLAGKTGGFYFEVDKKKTLEQIYCQIEDELRSQYSLGYAPDAYARDGYRKIEVRVLKKGMTAYCRDGYYPKIVQELP